MKVKSIHEVIQSRTLKVWLAVAILLFAAASLTAFIPDTSKALSKRMNIAMRAIGHDLLLRAGDFTSVIPPVIEKSAGVFVIEFENEFAFQPDTLVEIVQRHVSKTGLSHYAVTVQNCNRPYIVYGFEIILPNNTTIPCRGRQHPKACYTVEIAFADFPHKGIPYGPTALIITGVLSAIGLVIIGKNDPLRPTNLQSKISAPTIAEVGNHVSIGQFNFNIDNQTLAIEDELIPLTDKESKVLKLLQQNFGELTPREILIQQVWTDEGVITGRSLDMFISKLRKKLGRDPEVRITSVHGKGYKLELKN